MKKNIISEKFDAFACTASKATGSSAAFIMALCLVIGWAVTGPFFHFSETWQLVINTGTTIITFLMVFIIQQAQNKDTVAIHLKLDELIAATQGASNRIINIEDLTEAELKTIKQFYAQLYENSKETEDIGQTHSIDQADRNQAAKDGGELN
jgi:low affinity Fe/Cu permease